MKDTAYTSIRIALALCVGAYLHDWKYFNAVVAFYLVIATICLVLHGIEKFQKGRRS